MQEQAHLVINKLHDSHEGTRVEVSAPLLESGLLGWLKVHLNGIEPARDADDGWLELRTRPLLEEVEVYCGRHEHALEIAAHLQQTLQHSCKAHCIHST